MHTEIPAYSVSTGRARGRLQELKRNPSAVAEASCVIILIDDLRVEKVMAALDHKGLNGVVSKRGGFAAHGASILREANIPCVIVSQHDRLAPLLGKVVAIDANAGKVILD
jgi:phosphoenolpyruvate-protein kinase (PTS system EI component)